MEPERAVEQSCKDVFLLQASSHSRLEQEEEFGACIDVSTGWLGLAIYRCFQ